MSRNLSGVVLASLPRSNLRTRRRASRSDANCTFCGLPRYNRSLNDLSLCSFSGTFSEYALNILNKCRSSFLLTDET